MVVRKLEPGDLATLDTKNRIVESAIHLFALKGFDGASIREIAKLASVNVASMNYHFKSKENLRQEILDHICNDFKNKISSISEVATSAEFAVKLYETLTEDSAKCLNQFKLILEAETHPCGNDPYPMGFEQFSFYLKKELNPSVPESELIWMVSILFGYTVHISVMSATTVGKISMENHFPNKIAAIPVYIRQLVETLIRDLNQRYPV